MLPRNVIEEYLKSYREYLILEAEKARELKILKQLENFLSLFRPEAPCETC